MPLVSVVIPTYNSGKYLADAINSVLMQGVQDIEIIVVDDGSTDNTKNIISEYGEKVSYYYQENSGSGRARNHGVFKSTGDMIAFLDSDDYWDSDHLETMISTLNDFPEACLVYCGKKWVDEQGNELTEISTQKSFPSGWIFREMFEDNYISSSSVVVARKSFLLQVGCFDESQELRNAQDYELWLRMSSMYEVAATPLRTVNYRVHDSNKTRDEVSRRRGLLYALKSAGTLIEKGVVNQKNEPFRIDVKQRVKQQYESAAIFFYHTRQYCTCRRFCIQAIKSGYCSVPLVLRFFLVILPSPLRTIVNSLKKHVF